MHEFYKFLALAFESQSFFIPELIAKMIIVINHARESDEVVESELESLHGVFCQVLDDVLSVESIDEDIEVLYKLLTPNLSTEGRKNIQMDLLKIESNVIDICLDNNVYALFSCPNIHFLMWRYLWIPFQRKTKETHKVVNFDKECRKSKSLNSSPHDLSRLDSKRLGNSRRNSLRNLNETKSHACKRPVLKEFIHYGPHESPIVNDEEKSVIWHVPLADFVLYSISIGYRIYLTHSVLNHVDACTLESHMCEHTSHDASNIPGDGFNDFNEFLLVLMIISGVLYEYGQLLQDDWDVSKYFHTFWNAMDACSLLLLLYWLITFSFGFGTSTLFYFWSTLIILSISYSCFVRGRVSTSSIRNSSVFSFIARVMYVEAIWNACHYDISNVG